MATISRHDSSYHGYAPVQSGRDIKQAASARASGEHVNRIVQTAMGRGGIFCLLLSKTGSPKVTGAGGANGRRRSVWLLRSNGVASSRN